MCIPPGLQWAFGITLYYDIMNTAHSRLWNRLDRVGLGLDHLIDFGLRRIKPHPDPIDKLITNSNLNQTHH